MQLSTKQWRKVAFHADPYYIRSVCSPFCISYPIPILLFQMNNNLQVCPTDLQISKGKVFPRGQLMQSFLEEPMLPKL